MELLHDLFFDYTIRTVALGAAILGLVSGMLGSYAVLRKQSLLGDAVSHAALPGVALGFIIFGSKAPIVLMGGALVAGWIGALFVMQIVKQTQIKYDSALGLVLAVFFGFGLVLLTWIQQQADASQAGLDKFLFGQAAALLVEDVWVMASIGLVALVGIMLFWKEFKLLCFDTDFGASLGLPMARLDLLLTTLIVLGIIIGLQTVGVVLMSAMLIAPAAAARQWTDSFSVMMILSALFGALAGVSGALISSLAANLPTGPIIVLCISAIFGFSLFFAGNRGLFWRWMKDRKKRQHLRLEAVLLDLYALALHHENLSHPHTLSTLRAMSNGKGGVKYSLEIMEAWNWVDHVGPTKYALTETGVSEAARRLEKYQSQISHSV